MEALREVAFQLLLKTPFIKDIFNFVSFWKVLGVTPSGHLAYS